LARAAGATLRRYGDLELPDGFSPPESEYAAARGAAALFDFSFRSALGFVGADRQEFLHNLLSNDIRSLRPGAGCYATLLTQQSRIVSDAYVFCAANRFRLDVDALWKDRARDHLQKFLVAEDVEIEDLGGREAVLGVFGPRAADVLREAGAEPPAGELEHGELRLADLRTWVARVDWTGDGGFEVVVERQDAEAAWRALTLAGCRVGLVPAGMAALDVLRLEAGIPWPGIDFDETHLVLEAGLERGINFRKGCYLGQEVVERTSSRGHVNRRLVGLRVEAESAPRRGARILDEERECGHVTSAAWSPHLQAPVALGYVRREVKEPGNRLRLEVAEGVVPAEVVALPFYRPAGRRTIQDA
jgi:glycine cleavage system T protein